MKKIIAIILVVAVVLLISSTGFIIGDYIFGTPDSVLKEHCYYSGGPGVGISYSERGQIIEVGCTDSDDGFYLNHIMLQAGYIIDVPSGTIYLRLYTIDGGNGLPDELLTETPIELDSLDLEYNSYDWIPLYFYEDILLQYNTKYAVTWVYPDYFPGVGFMNVHTTDVGETGYYTCGNGVVRHEGQPWEFLEVDFVFEAYGYT